MVVKNDGRRERFDRNKLRAGPGQGLREAAGPPVELDAIVDEIETLLHDAEEREIADGPGRRHRHGAPARARQGRLRPLRLRLPEVRGRGRVPERAEDPDRPRREGDLVRRAPRASSRAPKSRAIRTAWRSMVKRTARFYGPIVELSRLQGELNRLFAAFVETNNRAARPPDRVLGPQRRRPRRRRDDPRSSSSCPGVEADDVKVSIRGRVLMIRGTKKGRIRAAEGMRFFCMERYFGGFVKSVPLPRPVNSHHAKTRMKHGLLEVDPAARAGPAREGNRDPGAARSTRSSETDGRARRQRDRRAERDADLPIPDILPVLPLKDVVVFPFIILPLSVSREKSINAVDAALAEQRIIMLVAQKDAQNDTPRPEDLYPVGTVAAIMRMLKLPDGRIRLLVQGLSRARLDSVLAEEPYLKAKITRLEESPPAEELPPEHEALLRSVKQNLEKSVSLGKNISPEVMVIAGNLDDPGAAGRPRGLEPRPEARRGAEDPGVDRPDRAPAPGQRQPRQGDHRPDDAAGDLHAGARRDGQVAARVLPAPAAAGDPAGARRGRGDLRGARRATARSSSTRRSRRKRRPRSRSRSSGSSAATPTPPRRRSSARTSTG